MKIKESPSEALQKYGIPDDKILEIACTKTLKDGIAILKDVMHDSWDIDTLTAMKIVKSLKEELL